MDSQRQRMRPWLEAKVNSGTIKGLLWIDKERLIFRVPWKHGGKHDWNEEDSVIFKEWALHTGRFREGVDQVDYPTWKTRFRCALNKLPDIQEVKEFSKLDGTEPFRAYRFLTREELQRIRARQGEERISFDLTDLPRQDIDGTRMAPPLPDVVTSSPVAPPFQPAARFNNLPNLPSDLDEINLEPLKSDSMNSIKREPMDTDHTCINDGHEIQKLLRGSKRAEEPHLCELQVKVKYCQRQVLDCRVTNASGCRLYYGQQVDSQVDILHDEMFGSRLLEQIQFPQCETPNNPAQERHTQDLLNAFERGLILECHNGCVYATRKSRCVIFISSPIVDNGEPFKLERDKKVKVFDYLHYFEPMLQHSLYTLTEKPKPYFLIGFGQKLQTGQSLENSNLLISGIVYYSKADFRLSQVSCNSPVSPPLEVSASDDYDKFLKHARAELNQPVHRRQPSPPCVVAAPAFTPAMGGMYAHAQPSYQELCQMVE